MPRSLALIVNDYETTHAAINQLRRRLDGYTIELQQALSDNLPIEGTTTVELADGRKVSVTTKLNRSVDTEDIDKAHNRINVAKFFKRSYSLVVAAYRKATPGELEVLNELLVTKPGKPTVKIRRPE